MIIKRFEDITAWKKAQDLTVEIYSIFRNFHDFEFRNQILRASISISNNIAEGFERNSDADFSRFLYISLASCSEVKSMLYLAEKLNYLESNARINLTNKTSEISRIINGLIKSLKT